MERIIDRVDRVTGRTASCVFRLKYGVVIASGLLLYKGRQRFVRELQVGRVRARGGKVDCDV